MISVDYEQVVYNGNGIQNAWPYSFPIYDGDVVRLILLDADGTETDITQDYFVDVPGSTVYYPGYAPGAEPPLEDQPPKVQTGQKLIVYRDTEITQDSDLGDSWPFNVIEKGLDKLTMILQEKAFALARSLKISQGQAAEIDDYDTTVPLAADKVICGNADGNGFEAREAMMEVNGAWDGEGRQIHSVADPTADQDAATKKYTDTRMDSNFMKMQADGTAWESRNLPISNVAGPALVKDAANKDYVDRILAGYSGQGDRFVFFDTVAQMKAADLVPSQMAVTLGYNDVNDNGAGVYTIRDIGGDTPDEGSIIEITGTSYVAELITDGVVNVKQFGAKGDGVTDDTVALHNCVAASHNVYFPDGVYMISGLYGEDSGNSMYPMSNSRITLSNNATVKVITNGETHYAVFMLENVSDVIIEGGKIVGDLDTHTGSTGQWGIGIEVLHSTNIVIRNMDISKCWGDSIYVGTPTPGYENKSKNVEIDSCVLHDSRRQGISVTGCDWFNCHDTEIYGIGGQSPQAGIDFEVNVIERGETPVYSSTNCVVHDCYIHDCAGYSIQMFKGAEVRLYNNILDSIENRYNWYDVVIDNCSVSKSAWICSEANVTIQNCHFPVRVDLGWSLGYSYIDEDEQEVTVPPKGKFHVVNCVFHGVGEYNVDGNRQCKNAEAIFENCRFYLTDADDTAGESAKTLLYLWNAKKLTFRKCYFEVATHPNGFGMAKALNGTEFSYCHFYFNTERTTITSGNKFLALQGDVLFAYNYWDITKFTGDDYNDTQITIMSTGTAETPATSTVTIIKNTFASKTNFSFVLGLHQNALATDSFNVNGIDNIIWTTGARLFNAGSNTNVTKNMVDNIESTLLI